MKEMTFFPMKNQTAELLLVIMILKLRIKVTMYPKDGILIHGKGVHIMYHIHSQGHQGQGQGHILAVDGHMTRQPVLIGC